MSGFNYQTTQIKKQVTTFPFHIHQRLLQPQLFTSMTLRKLPNFLGKKEKVGRILALNMAALSRVQRCCLLFSRVRDAGFPAPAASSQIPGGTEVPPGLEPLVSAKQAAPSMQNNKMQVSSTNAAAETLPKTGSESEAGATSSVRQNDAHGRPGGGSGASGSWGHGKRGESTSCHLRHKKKGQCDTEAFCSQRFPGTTCFTKHLPHCH